MPGTLMVARGRAERRPVCNPPSFKCMGQGVSRRLLRLLQWQDYGCAALYPSMGWQRARAAHAVVSHTGRVNGHFRQARAAQISSLD